MLRAFSSQGGGGFELINIAKLSAEFRKTTTTTMKDIRRQKKNKMAAGREPLGRMGHLPLRASDS